MRITNSYSYSPKFNAKFFQCDDMEKVVKYALDHGQFDRLYMAKNNISSVHPQTLIEIKIGETCSGYPSVAFKRYTPQISPSARKSDYNVSEPIVYSSGKHIDPLKFALEQIIKMGNGIPNNKIFRKVVVGDK